jgi:hypothetical protein
MEITDELATKLSVLVGDESMRIAGRSAWSIEDSEAAARVYNKLRPVQKMDKIDDAFGTDHKGDAVWPYSGQR